MALGIDLGTCNTLASTIGRDGMPLLIPDCNNREITSTPSILYIENKFALVGANAEQYMDLYPEKNFVRYYKRNFGTQNPVMFDEAGNPWFSEAAAAIMLKKIKYDAEAFLHDSETGAVITVPAHYNDAQRRSVIEAARLADLRLESIIDEPIAAAINYVSKLSRNEEIILVYDFGGGTFDLTLMTKSGTDMFVVAKDGLSNLGGKEFDELIAQKILDDYSACYKENLPMNVANSNKLRKLSESIKLKIVSDKKGYIANWLTFGKNAFEFILEVSDFSEKCAALILMTDKVVERCLKSVGISFSDVAKLILVGGTSKVPFVKEYWAQKINPSSQELIFHDPMNSVALGAAVYSSGFSASSSKNFDLKTVASYNLALQGNTPADARLETLIQKNSPLPLTAQKLVQIQPSAVLNFDLYQYWDSNEEKSKLGTIKLGPFETSTPLNLKILLENRANGTIGIKVKNADLDKDVRFEFVKTKSQFSYNFDEQKKLVDGLVVNNMI